MRDITNCAASESDREIYRDILAENHFGFTAANALFQSIADYNKAVADENAYYRSAAYAAAVEAQRQALARAIAANSGGTISYQQTYDSLDPSKGYLQGGNYNFGETLFMALAILAAVRMQAGATGYISRTRALCTWIRRVRSRACLASSHTALWTFSLGMSLITSSLGLGHKREVRAHTNATSPVWKVDLRAVGFTGFAPTKETWGLHLKPNPLCFSDNKTLVATFISREDVTTLARRDTSGDARPDRLHGIFLNVQMGKVQGTKEWSVPRPRGGIIPTGNGRFVVLTPSMIALYSPAFELLQDFKFSSEQLSHLWDVHTSLSGKSILVEYHYPEATYQWLDSDTLQPLDARWSQSLPVLSISDDREIASFKNTYVQAKGIYIFEAFIQPRNGAERTVCRVTDGQGDSCGNPEFVSNDLLVLWMPHRFRVVPKTVGDALLKATFHEDEWLGRPLHPSADGKRLAVTVWAHKGGSAFFDIDSHSMLKRIVIYDLLSGQAEYTLDAKQQKIKDVSGVALSPDGSLLAILTDGVVEVYQLPPEHTDAVDLKKRDLHVQIPVPATKPKP